LTSVVPIPSPASTPAVEPAPASPPELADLLRAFNDVTGKLQSTHEELRGRVATLTRDLGEANAQLERAQRLAALGEMAAGIAHEVRNPLGGIRLYARMLEQDLTDRPREQGIARKIADAARVLEAVVGDVLSFSREFKLRPEPVAVCELFDAALEACCHDGVPGWRGVRIVRNDHTSAIREVVADRAVLHQAIVNVVRNAFQAMAETPLPNGRSDETHELVLDALTRVELDSKGRRFHGVALLIRDSGPGIAPETVARMFNPFFTTRNTGTGLGLAIVHRILDAHAGRVVARNNADDATAGNQARCARGATFELILPHGTRGTSQGRPVNDSISDVVVRTPARANPVETFS
jgi:signal transduction histidine kinase